MNATRLRAYIERELAREKRRAQLADARGLKHREFMGRAFAYADVLRHLDAQKKSAQAAADEEVSEAEADRLWATLRKQGQ